LIQHKKSITLKIFWITSLLIALTTSILFAAFYFLLPSFYYEYKINKLNHGIDQLLADVSEVPVSQAQNLLYEFTHDYNIHLLIRDQQGNMISIPSSSSPLVKIPYRNNYEKETDGIPPIRIIEKPISFQDGRFIAIFVATLQPIDEASNAILMLMPYMGFFVLLISMVGAFLYTKLITQPLLKINQVAKRMAKLDFSQRLENRSDDEIGELSQSLNELSQNLKQTMSELQQANAKLKNDIQREREQEAKRREWMATISHELKSPITAVMGQLEGMIHQIGVYKDRDKYLRRSYSIIKNMEQLVKEILEVSKLESDAFHPLKKTVSLSGMIQSVIKRLEFFHEDKQIRFDVNIEPDLFVTADPGYLQKAVANIIHNAINYAPSGETVRISLAQKNSHIEFHVLNTGASIPEAELQKVFEPFYRLEKSRNRNTGGSGLGLYIVKQILDIHSFPYQLTNEENGVLFTIHFPFPEQNE
jgi:two-component system, OmpR family, sensor histidine kinase VanS